MHVVHGTRVSGHGAHASREPVRGAGGAVRSGGGAVCARVVDTHKSSHTKIVTINIYEDKFKTNCHFFQNVIVNTRYEPFIDQLL